MLITKNKLKFIEAVRFAKDALILANAQPAIEADVSADC